MGCGLGVHGVKGVRMVYKLGVNGVWIGCEWGVHRVWVWMGCE